MLGVIAFSWNRFDLIRLVPVCLLQHLLGLSLLIQAHINLGTSEALVSPPSINHAGPFYNAVSNGQTSSGTPRPQQAGALEHFSNYEASQNFLLSNQVDMGEIATMHPCTFPQFILPASIDTVVPSTSPQYFLPAAMDGQLLTYSGSENAAVDIMVSSDFPQFTLV